ncbi:MAG: DnaA/Hda family protein [Cypionkella sp.]|nr:DnaA/Hda family protein [Cypionkella sp.]
MSGRGQLAFDLGGQGGFARDDFFPSASNRAALAAMDGWQGWPAGRMMVIGPHGAGKTHLAHIWAAQSGAQVLNAAELPDADLAQLAAGGSVAVDDAQDLPPAGEAALFHLHNLLSNAGHLLICARTPPRDWGLALPDLLSRMQAMPITQLASPDETLIAAVLVKLFADRQITVPPNLIAYLAPRIERSIGAARDIVAQLDAAALAQGRAVTRALAAELLDNRPDA